MKKTLNDTGKLRAQRPSQAESIRTSDQSRPTHRTVGLKARTYRKAVQTVNAKAANLINLRSGLRKNNLTIKTELNRNTVPDKSDSNKENNNRLINRPELPKENELRDSTEIERVGIKEYISNIVDKINKLEVPKRQPELLLSCNESNILNIPTNRSNYVSNQVLEHDFETVGLRSMKSEGGLLKIKRKRSTLKLYNPYD